MPVCLLLVWLSHHCWKKKAKICNELHIPCQQPSLKTMLWWPVSSTSSNNLYSQAIQGKMVWLKEGAVLCLDTCKNGCRLPSHWHQALPQSQARTECCWNLKWAKAHQCLLMWSAFMSRLYWFWVLQCQDFYFEHLSSNLLQIQNVWNTLLLSSESLLQPSGKITDAKPFRS